MIKWSRGGQWDCGTASNERCYRLRVLLLGKQWISGLQWRWPFQLLEYQLGRGGWVDLTFDLIWFQPSSACRRQCTAELLLCIFLGLRNTCGNRNGPHPPPLPSPGRPSRDALDTRGRPMLGNKNSQTNTIDKKYTSLIYHIHTTLIFFPKKLSTLLKLPSCKK